MLYKRGCSLIAVLISLIIIKYVYDLENKKCKCSKDWRRDYIKIFAFITLVISVISCALTFSKVVLSNSFRIPIHIILSAYMIASIVNIYALFTYSQKLMVYKKCHCSDTWSRTFLYYYSMVFAVLYFCAIILGITIGINYSINPNIRTRVNTILNRRK